MKLLQTSPPRFFTNYFCSLHWFQTISGKDMQLLVPKITCIKKFHCNKKIVLSSKLDMSQCCKNHSFVVRALII